MPPRAVYPFSTVSPLTRAGSEGNRHTKKRRFLNVIFSVGNLRNFQIRTKISGKDVQVDYICRQQAIAIWLAVSATYNPTWADRLLLSFRIGQSQGLRRGISRKVRPTSFFIPTLHPPTPGRNRHIEIELTSHYGKEIVPLSVGGFRQTRHSSVYGRPHKAVYL